MKSRKQILYSIIMITTLFIFTACGSKSVPTRVDEETISRYSPEQIAEAVIAAIPDLPLLQPLLKGGDYFGDYLSIIYEIDESKLEDGAIFYANGAYASEIAVFKLTGIDRIKETTDALSRYTEHRANVFSGYAPNETAMLKNSRISSRGNYVALLICSDPLKAESVFLACFSDSPPELPDKPAPESPGTEAPSLSDVIPDMPDPMVTPDPVSVPDTPEAPPAEDIPVVFDTTIRVEYFDPEKIPENDPLIPWSVEAWANFGYIVEKEDKSGLTEIVTLTTKDALAHKEAVMFFKGPIALARDIRLGDSDVFSELPAGLDMDDIVSEEIDPPQGIWKAYSIKLPTGKDLAVCDFSSAGNTWSRDSLFSTWSFVEKE